jgi:hypothetical protein
MIEGYRFGRFEFGGKEYTSDVIIHGDQVTSWWRVTGHAVAREDIEPLVSEKPAVIVIGSGTNGLMKVPEATSRFIESNGIQLIVEETAQAVQTFNRLLADGADVAIAMHLTC